GEGAYELAEQAGYGREVVLAAKRQDPVSVQAVRLGVSPVHHILPSDRVFERIGKALGRRSGADRNPSVGGIPTRAGCLTETRCSLTGGGVVKPSSTSGLPWFDNRRDVREDGLCWVEEPARSESGVRPRA